ncbi:MAG: hypothetical protein HYT97_06610 [Elusimicrobia bacterium]|nr:hypothetical protein [Elusimicrobiota bacterium]
MWIVIVEELWKKWRRNEILRELKETKEYIVKEVSEAKGMREKVKKLVEALKWRKHFLLQKSKLYFRITWNMNHKVFGVRFNKWRRLAIFGELWGLTHTRKYIVSVIKSQKDWREKIKDIGWELKRVIGFSWDILRTQEGIEYANEKKSALGIRTESRPPARSPRICLIQVGDIADVVKVLNTYASKHELSKSFKTIFYWTSIDVDQKGRKAKNEREDGGYKKSVIHSISESSEKVNDFDDFMQFLSNYFKGYVDIWKREEKREALNKVGEIFRREAEKNYKVLGIKSYEVIGYEGKGVIEIDGTGVLGNLRVINKIEGVLVEGDYFTDKDYRENLKGLSKRKESRFYKKLDRGEIRERVGVLSIDMDLVGYIARLDVSEQERVIEEMVSGLLMKQVIGAAWESMDVAGIYKRETVSISPETIEYRRNLNFDREPVFKYRRKFNFNRAQEAVLHSSNEEQQAMMVEAFTRLGVKEVKAREIVGRFPSQGRFQRVVEQVIKDKIARFIEMEKGEGKIEEGSGKKRGVKVEGEKIEVSDVGDKGRESEGDKRNEDGSDEKGGKNAGEEMKILVQHGGQSAADKSPVFATVVAEEKEINSNQDRRQNYLVRSAREDIEKKIMSTPQEEIVEMINRVTGERLKPTDFSGLVKVKYHREGTHKLVFIVSFDLRNSSFSPELIFKKEIQPGDITEREIKDLMMLDRDGNPYTPKFGMEWKEDGRQYYLEQYIKGDTVEELKNWEGESAQEYRRLGMIHPPEIIGVYDEEHRKAVVESLLGTTLLLGGQMPKDMHDKNFVRSVMVDIGERRQPIDKSLLRVIGFYGYFGEIYVSNRFVFQAYIDQFGKIGKESGIEILKRNLAHIKEMRVYDKRTGNLVGQTSLEKGKVREERGEPALQPKDVDRILGELEQFIAEYESSHLSIIDVEKEGKEETSQGEEKKGKEEGDSGSGFKTVGVIITALIGVAAYEAMAQAIPLGSLIGGGTLEGIKELFPMIGIVLAGSVITAHGRENIFWRNAFREKRKDVLGDNESKNIIPNRIEKNLERHATDKGNEIENAVKMVAKRLGEYKIVKRMVSPLLWDVLSQNVRGASTKVVVNFVDLPSLISTVKRYMEEKEEGKNLELVVVTDEAWMSRKELKRELGKAGIYFKGSQIKIISDKLEDGKFNLDRIFKNHRRYFNGSSVILLDGFGLWRWEGEIEDVLRIVLSVDGNELAEWVRRNVQGLSPEEVSQIERSRLFEKYSVLIEESREDVEVLDVQQ